MGNFKDLKIFEDEQVNEFCDVITDIVRDITGEELALCGSVAKHLHGSISEDYAPKDIDFVVDKEAFYKLYRAFPMDIDKVISFEFQPLRIILWTELEVGVEIWLQNQENEQKLMYNKKIPYRI